jgi:hypothetical protein
MEYLQRYARGSLMMIISSLYRKSLSIEYLHLTWKVSWLKNYTVLLVYVAHPTPCVTHGDRCPARVVTHDWALEVPCLRKKSYIP